MYIVGSIIGMVKAKMRTISELSVENRLDEMNLAKSNKKKKKQFFRPAKMISRPPLYFVSSPVPLSSSGPPQITARDKCSRSVSYDYLSPSKRRARFATSSCMLLHNCDGITCRSPWLMIRVH